MHQRHLDFKHMDIPMGIQPSPWGKTANLEIQRLNYSFIMEYFLKEGLEGNDLTELKKCILFLKATCLSDIIIGDGKSISVTAWNGI